MSDMWWRSAIVLVVFVWGGLAVGNICRVELSRMGEELRWLDDIVDLNFGEFLHLLEF